MGKLNLLLFFEGGYILPVKLLGKLALFAPGRGLHQGQFSLDLQAFSKTTLRVQWAIPDVLSSFLPFFKFSFRLCPILCFISCVLASCLPCFEFLVSMMSDVRCGPSGVLFHCFCFRMSVCDDFRVVVFIFLHVVLLFTLFRTPGVDDAR